MVEGSTIGARLRAARLERQLSLESVGKHVGITAQAVQSWEKDRTTPDANRLNQVALLLGCTIEWLLTGASGNAVRPIDNLGGRRVPHYAFADGATGSTPATSYTHAHYPCSARSFALTIPDQANAPGYLPGDSVVIDPALTAVPGDMVYAVVGAGQTPVFRRLAVTRTSPTPAYRLEPLNAAYPTEYIDDDHPGRIVGVMSEHAHPRRV